MIYMQRIEYDIEFGGFRLSIPEPGDDIFTTITSGSALACQFFKDFIFDPYPKEFPLMGDYVFRLNRTDFIVFHYEGSILDRKMVEKEIEVLIVDAYKKIRIGLSNGLDRVLFKHLELFYYQEYGYLSLTKLYAKKNSILADIIEGMLQILEYHGIEYDPTKKLEDHGPFELDPFSSWGEPF